MEPPYAPTPGTPAPTSPGRLEPVDRICALTPYGGGWPWRIDTTLDPVNSLGMHEDAPRARAEMLRTVRAMIDDLHDLARAAEGADLFALSDACRVALRAVCNVEHEMRKADRGTA